MAKFKRIVAAVMVAATMTTSAIGGMSANADYTDTNITNFIARVQQEPSIRCLFLKMVLE